MNEWINGNMKAWMNEWIKSLHISYYFFALNITPFSDRDSALFKVFFHKSEGRWFDPSRCDLEFFIDIKSFLSQYGPGFDSASNKNK